MTRFNSKLAIVVLTVAMAAPAHAQLGDLMKRAAQKAADQHQSHPNARPSSAFGPELTEQSISSVLKGLEAEQQILNQRDPIAAKRDSLSEAGTKLREPHNTENDAFNTASSKWTQCRDGVSASIDKEHQASVATAQQALMSDPTKLAQMQQNSLAMQTQMMALMQKGDTAGAQKLAADFTRTQMGINIDPAADTARMVKVCGSGPAKPAWMVQANRDDAQADTLNTRVRQLEDSAQTSGAGASGLPPEQFAQARERLVNWYRGGKDNNSIQQFSKRELNIIHEHQAEIEKLKRVL